MVKLHEDLHVHSFPDQLLVQVNSQPVAKRFHQLVAACDGSAIPKPIQPNCTSPSPTMTRVPALNPDCCYFVL